MKDFQIQGINHIALVCKDMTRTVDFYTQTLGVQVTTILHHADVPSGYVPERNESTFISSFYFFDPDGILLEFAANLRKEG
ncbi:hypothetical protein RIVM261_068050 [Rivularia sp. IAM M-261]|nr:hypothetical protein RIVM261_068050 [Rivularia sp. IAM M-261]